jgi:hypothetical protein
MRKQFSIALILTVASFLSWAEDSSEQVKTQIQQIEKRIDGLDKSARQTQGSTQELKMQLAELTTAGKAQQLRITELGAKLSELEGKLTALGAMQADFDGRQIKLVSSFDQLSRDTDLKTQTIDETITGRSKWYGAAIAMLLILLGGCYWHLRRRVDMSEQTLWAQVKSAMDTARITGEKIAKTDTALADSLFEILNKLKVQESSTAATSQGKPIVPDHHLPLKLADEIHRMRKRLTSLPEDTKGLTPLQKSLERLEAELAEQGYEIVDHTGMGYTDNLSVKARFVPSDDLGPDQKIISKVIVPQMNYKGVMIRMADIEVSIGS